MEKIVRQLINLFEIKMRLNNLINLLLWHFIYFIIIYVDDFVLIELHMLMVILYFCIFEKQILAFEGILIGRIHERSENF